MSMSTKYFSYERNPNSFLGRFFLRVISLALHLYLEITVCFTTSDSTICPVPIWKNHILVAANVAYTDFSLYFYPLGHLLN